MNLKPGKKKVLTGSEAAFPLLISETKWNAGMSSRVYMVTELLKDSKIHKEKNLDKIQGIIKNTFDVVDEIIKQENERS